jgi:uncharacterized membrane protein HdeD (DUF308 family)
MEFAMARTSLIVGGLLIVLALVFFLATLSGTALSPLAPGIPILVCGVIAMQKETARKHAMHVAMVFALLGILGSGFPILSGAGEGGRLNAILESLIMALICAFYLGMGVQSFIAARQATEG